MALKSTLILLTLIITVSCQIHRSTIYVNKGEQFTLPCKNETPGMYIGMVWREKTAQLYSDLRRHGWSIHEKIYKRSRLVEDTSLQIDNASVGDAATYQCGLVYIPKNLTIPHAIIASTIEVIVSVRPTITALHPTTQFGSLGEEAQITCKFQGIPSVNVTWKFNGKRDMTRKSTTHGDTSVLKLDQLRKKHTGKYTCSAYNRAGEVKKRAYIKVMYPPRMVHLTSKPHINVGRSGTIRCKAKGYPLPHLHWNFRKDHSLINLKSEEKYKHQFSVSKTIQNRVEESSESVLTIHSATVEDWRVNFTCVAANSEGLRNSIVNVKGFDKPTPPIVDVDVITANEVLVQWSVVSDGGSKVLAYTVQYKMPAVKEWTSKDIHQGHVLSFRIVGLKPKTLYLFRVSAKNEVGKSDFSKTVMLFTKKNLNGVNGTVLSKKDDPNVVRRKNGSDSGSLGGLSITAIIGIAVGMLVVIIACVSVACLLRRQKPANSQTTSILGSRPVSMDNGSLPPPAGRRPSEMISDNTEFIPLMTKADHWQFPRDRLRLSTVLGSGAFGMVMRGDAHGIRGSNGNVKVAVKIAKDDVNENARKDLHAELEVLKLIPEHANVVGLLGCCTRNEPLMIIVEYCAHGDLQGFLRNSRGISESYYKSNYHPIRLKMTSKMLLNFAVQVAKGMSHLAAFKVIHRDLAARNVLVDGDLVCKISDFGFARDIYVEDQYMKMSKGGRFPIKWMALESLLDGISTPKSDVWAFGVVLWEIVTLGASPYLGMNSYEVVSFLQDGHRMDKPKHCSDELYALAINCWNAAPQRRPTFDELANMLMDMLGEDKEYINMNFYQDHLYENFDVNLACKSSANGSGIELNPNDVTPLRLSVADTSNATTS